MTISTDVVIVGAGPCGLFQVFELGLLGLKAEVIDSLRQPGGQCAELYPDKPIYDIPAIPECTGEELTDQLLKQIEPFGAGMHLGEEVCVVEKQGDGKFHIETNKGTVFSAGAVVIAGGVGSFQPRPIRVSMVEQYEGKTIHYRVRDPKIFEDKEIVVFGGGDSAVDWVLNLAEIAKKISVVHRRDEWRAAPASVEKMKGLAAQDKVEIHINSKIEALHGADGALSKVSIKDQVEGTTTDIQAQQMLVFFGLIPKLGPIAEWGLDMNRKTINVDTEKFQTSEPGIYAVGDINHYPGKKKLILCGFHEAALAAFAIKQQLEPDKKVHVQYTTTSPIMHERLGLTEDDSP